MIVTADLASGGEPSRVRAKMISAVLNAVEEQRLAHHEVAHRSEVSRRAVAGILSGSLQRVTIDRVLRLVDAVGLMADARMRRAA